jgi:hypothetical protein
MRGQVNDVTFTAQLEARRRTRHPAAITGSYHHIPYVLAAQPDAGCVLVMRLDSGGYPLSVGTGNAAVRLRSEMHFRLPCMLCRSPRVLYANEHIKPIDPPGHFTSTQTGNYCCCCRNTFQASFNAPNTPLATILYSTVVFPAFGCVTERSPSIS